VSDLGFWDACDSRPAKAHSEAWCTCESRGAGWDGSLAILSPWCVRARASYGGYAESAGIPRALELPRLLRARLAAAARGTPARRTYCCSHGGKAVAAPYGGDAGRSVLEERLNVSPARMRLIKVPPAPCPPPSARGWGGTIGRLFRIRSRTVSGSVFVSRRHQ
jgi:hypothetical protein